MTWGYLHTSSGNLNIKFVVKLQSSILLKCKFYSRSIHYYQKINQEQYTPQNVSFSIKSLTFNWVGLIYPKIFFFDRLENAVQVVVLRFS